MYKTRSTSRLITRALKTPPMTTVAKGRWTSAPIPVLKAIGRNPRLATSAVINTGRRRVIAASSTACSSGVPRRRNWRMYETNSMSSSTATPDRATKPTAAEIEKGMSRIQRARIPPTQANGTPVNTRKASITLR